MCFRKVQEQGQQQAGKVSGTDKKELEEQTMCVKSCIYKLSNFIISGWEYEYMNILWYTTGIRPKHNIECPLRSSSTALKLVCLTQKCFQKSWSVNICCAINKTQVTALSWKNEAIQCMNRIRLCCYLFWAKACFKRFVVCFREGLAHFSWTMLNHIKHLWQQHGDPVEESGASLVCLQFRVLTSWKHKVWQHRPKSVQQLETYIRQEWDVILPLRLSHLDIWSPQITDIHRRLDSAPR